MLSGKKFRLTTAVLGVENLAQGRRPVEVGPGETITVLHGPKPDDRMLVDVRWRSRTLVMFAQDIEKRGQEIRAGLAAGA